MRDKPCSSAVLALTKSNGADTTAITGKAIATGLRQRAQRNHQRPDVLSLAKGLGGGFPIGAVVAFGERAATLLGPGQHGSTFGGNPVAAAAGLATLGVLERDDVLAHVRELGARLATALAGAGPLVREVRGTGLLLAVELTAPVAAHVADLALAAGFIVNPVTPSALRLAPPLVLTWDQVAPFVAFLAALDPSADAALAPDVPKEPT